MTDMSNFLYLEKILNENKYKLERQSIKAIRDLNLISDNSICYIKNLFLDSGKIIFYVFNESKIYRVKINKEDDEIVEFELFDKCDIKSIKFTVDYDRDYTLSFSAGDVVECLDSTKDTNEYHNNNYNDIIRSIINYFN